MLSVYPPHISLANIPHNIITLPGYWGGTHGEELNTLNKYVYFRL
jgi:hypothetical protein